MSNIADAWDKAVAANAAANAFRGEILSEILAQMREGSKTALPVAHLARVKEEGAVEGGIAFCIDTVFVDQTKVISFMAGKGMISDEPLTRGDIEYLVHQGVVALDQHAALKGNPYDFRLFVTETKRVPSMKGVKDLAPGLVAIEKFRDHPVRVFEALIEIEDGLRIIREWQEMPAEEARRREAEFTDVPAPTSWHQDSASGGMVN